MIILLALMLAQVPPTPSGTSLPVGAVEIPNAIAPILDRYSGCVRVQMEARHAWPMIQRATYRRDIDASIAACASVRASAVAESETVLARASDYQDPVRRAQAIQHAFDGTDYQKRELLGIMDAIRRERAQAGGH